MGFKRRIMVDNTNYITYVINRNQKKGIANVKIYQKMSGCYVLVGTRIVSC